MEEKCGNGRRNGDLLEKFSVLFHAKINTENHFSEDEILKVVEKNGEEYIVVFGSPYDIRNIPANYCEKEKNCSNESIYVNREVYRKFLRQKKYTEKEVKSVSKIQNWYRRIKERRKIAKKLDEFGERGFSVNELVVNDDIYVSYLGVLEEVFYRPLEGKLSLVHYQNIFSNFHEVICTAREINQSLKVKNRSRMWGRLKAVIEKLEINSKFISNYPDACDLINRLQDENSTEAAAILKIRDQRTSNLDLQNLLVKPFQRLTTYNNIISKILDRTPKESYQYGTIQSILEDITRILKVVDLSRQAKLDQNWLRTNKSKLSLLKTNRERSVSQPSFERPSLVRQRPALVRHRQLSSPQKGEELVVGKNNNDNTNEKLVIDDEKEEEEEEEEEEEDEINHSLTCLCLGDPKSGKTSLFQTFVEGECSDEYVPTENDEKFEKKITFSEKEITLNMIDTSGKKYEEDITKEDIDVFFVLFSLVDRRSYENVETRWMKKIKRYISQEAEEDGEEEETIPIVLVGTHYDIRSEIEDDSSSSDDDDDEDDDEDDEEDDEDDDEDEEEDESDIKPEDNGAKEEEEEDEDEEEKLNIKPEEVVSEEEGEKLGARISAYCYIECSSYTGENLLEFQQALHALLKQHMETLEKEREERRRQRKKDKEEKERMRKRMMMMRGRRGLGGGRKPPLKQVMKPSSPMLKSSSDMLMMMMKNYDPSKALARREEKEKTGEDGKRKKRMRRNSSIRGVLKRSNSFRFKVEEEEKDSEGKKKESEEERKKREEEELETKRKEIMKRFKTSMAVISEERLRIEKKRIEEDRNFRKRDEEEFNERNWKEEMRRKELEEEEKRRRKQQQQEEEEKEEEERKRMMEIRKEQELVAKKEPLLEILNEEEEEKSKIDVTSQPVIGVCSKEESIKKRVKKRVGKKKMVPTTNRNRIFLKRKKERKKITTAKENREAAKRKVKILNDLYHRSKRKARKSDRRKTSWVIKDLIDEQLFKNLKKKKEKEKFRRKN